MELDITAMIEDRDTMPMLSGSAAELGENAGEITWNNSREYAKQHPLLESPDDFDEMINYFRSFGAWSENEVKEWTDLDVQAMTIQEIASCIREMEHYDTEEEYFEAAKHGRVIGLIFKNENKYYIYLGC